MSVNKIDVAEFRNQLATALKLQIQSHSEGLEELRKKAEELKELNVNSVLKMSEQIDFFLKEFEELTLDVEEKNKKLSEVTLLCEELRSDNFKIQKREDLVASLLSARNENPGVISFRNTLYEDFIRFANDEGSLKSEAEAILKLQEIEKELEVVSAYPSFHSKKTIAVAGGFSAGKSEFISSFFGSKDTKLPIGVQPTTAIPVYVLKEEGGKAEVLGYSNLGGVVDLLALDPELSHSLDHEFIQSFGFDLKKIMPFIFMAADIDYDNLCFVDTPGYNPSDTLSGYQNEDLHTAKNFVHNADALIWVIGIDSQGTIPKSDLDFLDAVLEDSLKPLYVVLNKADLRPEDQIEDIMDVVAEELEDYDVEFLGICAYSSTRKIEYLYTGQSLTDFLSDLDMPSNKHDLLIRKLYSVDAAYQKAILTDSKNDMQLVSILNGLKLDLLAEGFDEMDHELYEKISKMMKIFSSKQLFQSQLSQLEEVISKLAESIDRVFNRSSSRIRSTLTVDDVELDDSFFEFIDEKDL